VSPSATSPAGETNHPKNGRLVMANSALEIAARPWSGRCFRSGGHDVFGEPLPPLGSLFGAQLVIDDESLMCPLIGRREHARERRNLRQELGIVDHWTALLEIGDLCLYRRIECDIEEFVGEISFGRALCDAHGVNAEHRAFLGNDELDRNALI